MDYSVATLHAATAEVAAGTPLEPMYELADAAAIATAPAADGQAAAAAASAVAPDAGSPAGKFLYEGRYGLPVVRRYLQYHELLRDIRLERVMEVMFFSQPYDLDPDPPVGHPEGPCLVLYNDGRVAQSMIPPTDVRIPYAMETHGVEVSLLQSQPSEDMLNPPRPYSETITKFVSNVLPFAALALVYVATQVAAQMKGDRADRIKIQARKEADKRRMEDEQQRDELLVEATTMARMGASVDEIIADMQRLGLDAGREEIDRLVAVEARRRELEGDAGEGEFYNDKAKEQAEYNRSQKAREAMEAEGGDDMAKAEAFLQMTTAKLTKARDPKDEQIRIKEREAKRKMKGISLQYTEDDRVFFSDVAGIGDAKVELQEVVDFFTKPKLFRSSGARIPKGVLLCGPPGTGKTLLARAVAGEAGVAFLSLNASEFVEMFVGVGAARVRALFNQARALRPCIVFMDEIDAVGRVRGGARGNDERDQTLNQMLSEMDGFDAESGVIVMAATNRKDVLDPALVRPGRFDRIIRIGRPDFNGRIEILQVHLGRRPCADDLNLREIAFETQRTSGAQLANLVNLAASFVGRAGRDEITQADLLQALDWERLGPERKPYSESRRRRLAVQEAATALVATLQPAIEPVVHVTIVPREKFPLGQTVLKVNEQRELTYQFTRRYLQEQLLTVLAGRAAEELVYGADEMSTINQRRLVMARRIVQKLVVSADLHDNDELGPRTVSQPIVTGGSALMQLIPSRVTSETQAVADFHMELLLKEAYEEVKVMVARNRAALDVLVEALLANSMISGEEIRAVVERQGDEGDVKRRREEAAAFW